ncbi:MAG: O-antigen ligase family protein [Proteobacteria bacterium]|nr:O-antigen ligase family protein [Pseudomonadota bacterium]
MLLAYGSTGALIVTAMGSRGLRLLLLTFMAAGASIAALELVLLAARGAGMELSQALLWSNPRGFAQNRNAFAFQMLMVICTAIALAPPRWLSTAALAIALATIWATASRGGLGALFIVLAVALYVRAITPRNLAMALAGALGLLLAIILVELLVLLSMTESFSFSSLEKGLASAFHPRGEELERMRGIVGGMDLFRAHPFFGGGLGGFIHSEIGAGRAPLVIHSTPLWLLAETGLVGLVILSAPIFRIFRCEIRRDTPDNSAFLLMLIIAGFAVMSLVHEMLYQRTFWLLLGAALASPVVTRRGG